MNGFFNALFLKIPEQHKLFGDFSFCNSEHSE
jgi:hypothetical protein